MITVRIINEDPLFDIREAIATTIGKDNLKDFNGDLYSYYLTLFIQNHSILRSVRFRIKDTASDKSVARQLLRATTGSPQPYMESSRPDWTGKPRNDTETCFFTQDHTAESFMNEARQRLCFRAWAPTRKTVQEIIKTMRESGDPYFRALAVASVPNCVHQYGCPEGKMGCGWWGKNWTEFPQDLGLRRAKYMLMFLKKEVE